MSLGDLGDATIVFDLDGTLVDTAPDLARALNRTLDLEGLPPAPLATVRTLVGRGARALVERGAGLAGVPLLRGAAQPAHRRLPRALQR